MQNQQRAVQMHQATSEAYSAAVVALKGIYRLNGESLKNADLAMIVAFCYSKTTFMISQEDPNLTAPEARSLEGLFMMANDVSNSDIDGLKVLAAAHSMMSTVLAQSPEA